MTDSVAGAHEDQIDTLVKYFVSDIDVVRATIDQLRSALELPRLRSLYHSVRWRVKDPEHLREKLRRKSAQAQLSGTPFDITTDNLYERITDLAGIRLLHLHTTEIEAINAVLLDILDEHRYVVREGPEARVWDDDLEMYFKSIGIKSIRSKNNTMYTSVHYIVEPNTRTKRTAEIQVRTLAEELWGEVDHTLNYPVATPIRSCKDQIKVLARLSWSCTRLVDSIFATHREAVGESGPEAPGPDGSPGASA